jgi:hypothetical protein
MDKQIQNQDSKYPGNMTTPDAIINKLRWFITPLSLRGWPKWLVYLLMSVGVVYILNPTLGLFEFIPDNLPIIGNLDEGVAFMLIWMGIVEFFEGKNTPQTPPPPTPDNSDQKPPDAVN